MKEPNTFELSTFRVRLASRNVEHINTPLPLDPSWRNGGVAQMVERSLSMREVPGSMPGASTKFHLVFFHFNFQFLQGLRPCKNARFAGGH